MLILGQSLLLLEVYFLAVLTSKNYVQFGEIRYSGVNFRWDNFSDKKSSL